jgi:uncharacterized protein
MQKMVFAAVAAVLLVMQWSGPVEARPSFSCRGNGLTLDEVTICNDGYLSKLDRELAFLWKSLTARQKANLRDVQRDWLWRRGNCGDDSDCIESLYYEQISRLKAILGI